MSLFKSASTISLLTLASRVAGLVRDQLFAATFGANAMTDAFYVAFRIPNLFRRLFGEGAFSQAFVPVLAASKAKHGMEATKLLIDSVATLLTWVLVFTCVLGVLGAPLLVWAMAGGLQQEPQAYGAAITMTRWMFPYILFISLVSMASGILNTWRIFAVPAATPVLLNVAMIGATVWATPWFRNHGIEPIYAQTVGVMLGGVLQLGVQIPALKRLGLFPKIGASWSVVRAAWEDEATKNVAKLMVPALLGVGVAQISLFINTQIASRLAPGSVSWLSGADRLMEFPTAMLGVALGAVLMPQLAGAKAANAPEKYSAMLDWGLRLVVLLAVPCSVALLTFATPLVAVIFHYGAFTERDVGQTALALMGWGVGLLGVVAIKVLAPGFYASHNMKTPARIAIVVLVITQLINLALVPLLQHAALTLSVGLGALINALWLLIGLRQRGSYQPRPGWWKFSLQVVAASALLAVFLIWAAGAVPWTRFPDAKLERIGLLALVLLASAAIYFVALWAAGLKLRKLLRPDGNLA
ncbi:putative peptidoglycan lipid II flippase [Rhodoferax sp. OV413]|uniref:murein biosynthesis integral membrane protein MurJ n=1 Tax=Rhodoferax sp. OV413 TaxID=1855285 RepID=UPI000881F745|nr:murein biosynthesis integral membrane protein MurJ [Rhodoferax sp. OV413]SDO40390.1 putative peptidoglycan lipid II flippase [Rhodoferax sp. OV413]